VAVDGTSVYWVNAGDWGSADGTVMSQSNGTVMSMPLDGGAPTTLAAGQNFPDGIAVDATSVYWVDFGDYGLNDGAVMSIPIGQAADPVMLASGQPEASAIAVDATRVYWSCINGVAIAMVPLGGGTPETLGGWIGQALALDSTSVYWAGLSSILKVPLDGGATTTLASGLIEPVAVAVDTYSVYWTDQGTCPGDGGACSGAVMKLNPK
jgi:hypothetical protein